MFALARRLLRETPGPVRYSLLVFREELAGEVDDPWLNRILALADGRTSEEIAQVLYLDELRAGGETADIGLWRSLFFGQVEKSLKEMSDRGYVRLVPSSAGPADHRSTLT